MCHAIQERKYYALRIKLLSPLSVSSGQNAFTDSDVLANGSGELFVPGTSLAGSMRNYLELDKEQNGFFGYSKGKEGKMSAVFISDLYFEHKPTVSVRDGVELMGEKRSTTNLTWKLSKPAHRASST